MPIVSNRVGEPQQNRSLYYSLQDEELIAIRREFFRMRLSIVAYFCAKACSLLTSLGSYPQQRKEKGFPVKDKSLFPIVFIYYNILKLLKDLETACNSL